MHLDTAIGESASVLWCR